MRGLLLTLLFVIIVSGCIPSGAPSGIAGTNPEALAVNSFKFTPSMLKNGELAILELDVQNVGSLPISEAYVYLYGISGDWLISSPSGLETGERVITSDNKTIKLVSLDPPYEKLPGEKRQVYWPMEAPPALPDGETFRYQAVARLCFSYTTNAVAKVETVSQDEYISRRMKDELTEHPITMTQTASPLQAQIDSTQPVIAKDQVILKVKLVNSGKGELTKADCSDMTKSDADTLLRLGGLTLTLGGGRCETGLEDDQGIVDVSQLYFREEGGKLTTSFTATCYLSGLTSVPQQELDLILSFNYNYYIDTQPAVIAVEGTCKYGIGDTCETRLGAGGGAAYIPPAEREEEEPPPSDLGTKSNPFTASTISQAARMDLQSETVYIKGDIKDDSGIGLYEYYIGSPTIIWATAPPEDYDPLTQCIKGTVKESFYMIGADVQDGEGEAMYPSDIEFNFFSFVGDRYDIGGVPLDRNEGDDKYYICDTKMNNVDRSRCVLVNGDDARMYDNWLHSVSVKKSVVIEAQWVLLSAAAEDCS